MPIKSLFENIFGNDKGHKITGHDYYYFVTAFIMKSKNTKNILKNY